MNKKYIKEKIMEQNNYWPGAYNFQGEIRTLLEYMQEQIVVILEKIDAADELAQLN